VALRAVVRRDVAILIELELRPGLTVLTGETGAAFRILSKTIQTVIRTMITNNALDLSSQTF